ncbi:ketosteroid isomerase-like protein [Silvibacterium bohemicum]|uniref:Ketosteroid isomerase-like protein n=1 Tax=Silvibacterium bohemicum TaxID=1577686 RepID=A0A841K2D8_9BACT|nr:nuclear transport factor 2 family protein [Silvibacterium bohemicum]MBB6144808.1 ketosteroid isomerase-like protein [Silvibacterium bohemicum]
MSRLTLLCLSMVFAAPLAASAQVGIDPLSSSPSPANALTNPSYKVDIAFLFDLEKKFAHDTATGGGAAFAKWFADDAVTLADSEAPVIGLAAIAANTTWSADQYQLIWTPDGGRMSPAGDMGFTWGHYAGHGKDRNGNAVDTGGRYMTVWKRQADGTWKVELDASNREPAQKDDCCKLP